MKKAAGIVTTAAFGLCGCLMQPQKPRPNVLPPPQIIEHVQENADGSPVSYGGTTKAAEIKLGAVVDAPGHPNACPPETYIEIEVRRVADTLQGAPTLPPSPIKQCKTERCRFSLDLTLVEHLAGDSGYRWQARPITKFPMEFIDKDGTRCEPQTSTSAGTWLEFRPGTTPPESPAFLTPTVWKTVDSYPHSIRNVSGAIQQGDVKSLLDDDDQYLIVRSTGAPRRVAVDVIVPIASAGRQRKWTFMSRLRSTVACAGRLSLWNPNTSNWDSVAPISVDVQEGFYMGQIQPGPYIEAIPGLPPDTGGITLRVECQRTGGTQFNFSIDQIWMTYDIPS